MVDFWANVERILKAQGRKRTWLSKKTGISINTLNGWSKKGRHPRITDAMLIARALGTSVESLFGGPDAPDGASTAELHDIHALLSTLSRDELLEMRGVIRSYRDRYFRKRPD